MESYNTTLSKRGTDLAENPARIDMELFMEAAQNLYCPDSNPSGTFLLNVAENSLTASIIKDKLTSILKQKEMPDWVLKYTDSLGHPEVRAELANLMEQYLCKCPIDPDTLALSAGASAVIEVTSFILANPGDVAVIPAPSYPMYTKDMGTKSGVERYDLQTHFNLEEIESKAPVDITLLDKTFAELNAQNKCFKILLITSPDNPTGCRYTKEQLKELANWCIQHKVHMIVNEIYGLSLIDTQDPLIKDAYQDYGDYASFAKIMNELNSDYLHLWYAFSKDFSMSGLRFGMLHTLNTKLLKAYDNANIPHMVSNITQWMIAEMLKDSAFIEHYIKTNKALLNASYKLVIEAFNNINVPYIPSRGSLFVWVDLSRFLKEDSDDGQEQLWLDIYNNTGILLTPGAGFQHQKKGLFRMVFTAVERDYLKVAMDRLITYLNNPKD
ncbi:aminotransferase class I/II-fold pyridoxal phosphate-dependent enzyme [Yeosuana marina]|uniref:aminotransferase class I/II-fold pyridoxal phosphate-dependent enzyme n=1 Tax=Yeosuana marina TaxID=1565536 RepID=UPI0014206A0F|nr:aminotransferase class I/II-fold pyridoxal phosphate-dependent enzyme [Yeosuana marina]